MFVGIYIQPFCAPLQSVLQGTMGTVLICGIVRVVVDVAHVVGDGKPFLNQQVRVSTSRSTPPEVIHHGPDPGLQSTQPWFFAIYLIFLRTWPARWYTSNSCKIPCGKYCVLWSLQTLTWWSVAPRLTCTPRASRNSMPRSYPTTSMRAELPVSDTCMSCTKNSCKGKAVCAGCGEGHNLDDCQNEPRCVNCQGDHVAISRDCPKWKIEKDIVTLKYTENIFQESKMGHISRSMY